MRSENRINDKRRRSVSVKVELILVVCLWPGLTVGSALAQNAYDRGTPAESKGGQSSLSSYAPDKIETVNLANGNLNLHLPLVTIGGRGSAAYSVALTYNSKLWSAQHEVEVLTQHPGPPVKVHHYGTTYDDGNLTKPNLIPLGSGWSICKGPAIKVKQIGIDPLTCLNVTEGTVFKYALTRVWVVLPDGSEVEMRDGLTEGAPFLVQNPCGGTIDRNRGRVWHSTDGSAVTYVTDVDNGVGVGVNNFSGWVFLADGTRIRIGSGGRCKQILDRNGNIVDIAYDDSTVPGSATYTDELGRQIVLQPVINQSFEVTGATVTIKGYNGVGDRVVFIDTGTIGSNLRADSQTTHTIYNSDTDINGIHGDPDPNHIDMFPGSDIFVNETVINTQRGVTRLRLLDGRQFSFQYDRFGELAQIVYPGGGVSQIDYDHFGSSICDGGGVLNLQLNRRVTERRTLGDGVTVDATWTYQRGTGTIGSTTYPAVTLEAHQGTMAGPLLISEKHYFLALDAEYRTCSGLQGSNGTAYEKFENAREVQVDRSTGAGTQIDARVWEQRANVVWSFDPAYANDPIHGQENPSNDPRVVTEDTILENGRLKRERYDYDVFNNVTRAREYDFGQGAQGVLLKDTTRTYLTSQNNYCYTNLNGVDPGCGGSVFTNPGQAIHRRRLLLSETVKDGSGNIEAYSEYEYDNYLNEGAGGNHAPIQLNPGMIRYDGSVFLQFAADRQPRGNITRIKRLITGSPPPGSGTYATSYSQYDEAGNVVRALDPRGSPTTISYSDNFGDGSNPDFGLGGPNGATFALASSATNALGHVVKTQYDYTRGVPTGVKDPNLVVTRSEYNDPYDRPTRVIAAFGLAEAAKTEMTYQTATVNETTVSKQLDSTRWLAYKTTYDGFGRPVTANEAEDGNHASVAGFTISSKQVYDGLGRVKFATNPYRTLPASTDGWTRTAYDLAGRVINLATFSGGPDSPPPDYPATAGTGVSWTGSVTTAYASEATTVTDQAGKKRRSVVDGLGRLIRVDEPDSAGNLDNTANPPQPLQPTSYGYDSRGNLKTVTQGVQTRTFEYDGLSRLTRATNPESGVIIYAYDASSNLKTKLDARAITTTYEYDGLNRVTSRAYDPPATPSVNYYYDGQTVPTLPQGAPAFNRGSSTGRLVAVIYGGGNTGTYTGYDHLGRAAQSIQVTETQASGSPVAQAYGMTYGYNLAGEMISETYPSGRVVQTEYDSAGRIAGVKKDQTSYYAGAAATDATNRIQYTAHGAVLATKLGNGKWEHTSFNARLQPTLIGLGNSSIDSSILRLDYTYGLLVSGVLDPTKNNGNLQSQTIVAPTTNGSTATMVQGYLYDNLNRLSSANESGGWSQTFGYDRYGNRWVSGYIAPGNASLTPQSSSAFNAATNRLNVSIYDTSGNQIQDGAGRSFSYDAENRQVTFNSTAGIYSYDGAGRRVRKADASGTTIFIYNAGGQLIAEYSSAGTVSNSGISYLTSDFLASTRVVTDVTGNVKTRYDYLPFGEDIASNVGNRGSVGGYGTIDGIRQKFTQKERDSESGLDYFGARFYSSAQGRFTSVDPTRTSADAADPQSWNRFVYALNRVLIAVDPDGLATIIVVVSPRASRGTGQSTTYLQNRGGYYVRAGKDNGRFETLSRGKGPNRTVTNNDTPFGVYNIDHTRGDRDTRNPNLRTGTQGGTATANPRNDPAYGTGVVYLTPVAGEAIDNGRAQIYFHGGGSSLGSHAFDAEQGLTPTHGCIRCQNEDVNTIIEAVNSLDQGGDPVTHIFVGDAGYLRSLAEQRDANGNWMYSDLRIAMGYDRPAKEDRRLEKQRAREEANRQREDHD